MAKSLWNLFVALGALGLTLQAIYLGEWKSDYPHATFCLVIVVLLAVTRD